MDVATILHTLRDPAGIPTHPLVFQVLMVLTWAVHIFFVNLTLGTATVAGWGFFRGGEDHRRLSRGMTNVAKIALSLAIVTGVAPLLFTQVIYDPQWYTANVLSASWVMGFIFLLIVGYLLLYAFYFKNREGARPGVVHYLWSALVLLLVCGFVMHGLSYQQLLPEQWMDWYAPGGVVDPDGNTIHAFDLPRYVFFIGLSGIVAGIYMAAYARFFADREDIPTRYLDWVGRLGVRIALYAAAFELLAGVVFVAEQPARTGFGAHPLVWLTGVFLLSLIAMLFAARERAAERAYLLLGWYAAFIALVAAAREALRMAYMAPFDYSVMDYAVNVDWPSTFLFFATLVGVGGPVAGFFIAVAFNVGKHADVYQAGPAMQRLGNLALASLLAWIGVFFALGAWVWLGNL